VLTPQSSRHLAVTGLPGGIRAGQVVRLTFTFAYVDGATTAADVEVTVGPPATPLPRPTGDPEFGEHA
jgi:hypothetical protein